MPSRREPTATGERELHTHDLRTNMLFSHLKSPLSRLRPSTAQPTPGLQPPDYDPDLVSKDKARQREAVRRYLHAKVRNDWEFPWPPPSEPPAAADNADASTDIVVLPVDDGASGPHKTPNGDAPPSLGPSSTDAIDPAAPAVENNDDVVEGAEALDVDSGMEADSEAESVYSTMSEDPVHFRPRAEWTSDLSDDDVPTSPSPFRFDTPDSLGSSVKASVWARKARRRRSVRKEARSNDGLACFLARRDAWTGAVTRRVRSRPFETISPTSPRRLFWRPGPTSPAPAAAAAAADTSPPQIQTQTPLIAEAATPPTASLRTTPSGSSSGSHAAKAEEAAGPAPPSYPVETLLPIAPPLLPPENPMRATIGPSVYVSLYEKIVVHSMQPACPVNLSDLTRACVAGWKRDGDWPARQQVAAVDATAAAVVARRRMKQQHKDLQRKSVDVSALMAGGGGGGSTGTGSGEGRRRMSFPFLSRAGEKDEKDRDRDRDRDRVEDGLGAKGIRRSLQRVLGLGLGHGHNNHAHLPSATPVESKDDGQEKEPRIE